nr:MULTISPECIES: hypothetical protein [Acidiphilium]
MGDHWTVFGALQHGGAAVDPQHARHLGMHPVSGDDRVPMANVAQKFCAFHNRSVSFYRWQDSGLLFLINEALVAANRVAEGRDAAPTAAIIDSQSVKTVAR